jgi:hypothetical protein
LHSFGSEFRECVCAWGLRTLSKDCSLWHCSAGIVGHAHPKAAARTDESDGWTSVMFRPTCVPPMRCVIGHPIGGPAPAACAPRCVVGVAIAPCHMFVIHKHRVGYNVVICDDIDIAEVHAGASSPMSINLSGHIATSCFVKHCMTSRTRGKELTSVQVKSDYMTGYKAATANAPQPC